MKKILLTHLMMLSMIFSPLAQAHHRENYYSMTNNDPIAREVFSDIDGYALQALSPEEMRNTKGALWRPFQFISRFSAYSNLRARELKKVLKNQKTITKIATAGLLAALTIHSACDVAKECMKNNAEIEKEKIKANAEVEKEKIKADAEKAKSKDELEKARLQLEASKQSDVTNSTAASDQLPTPETNASQSVAPWTLPATAPAIKLPTPVPDLTLQTQDIDLMAPDYQPITEFNNLSEAEKLRRSVQGMVDVNYMAVERVDAMNQGGN